MTIKCTEEARHLSYRSENLDHIVGCKFASSIHTPFLTPLDLHDRDSMSSSSDAASAAMGLATSRHPFWTFQNLPHKFVPSLHQAAHSNLIVAKTARKAWRRS
jgi:hypothetical protein